METSPQMIGQRTGNTITLHQALDIFQDNLPDIITAMSDNLATEIAEEQKDAQVLGTGWVADEVRAIRMEQKFSDRTRRLNQARAYYNNLITPPSPSRITDADIARAKQHPIQDLYGGKLRKQGTKLWGCCPFHTESTPSFVIDTKRNNWRCFGACGTGGDSIAFYAKMHNLDVRKDFIKIIKALT